MNIKIKQKLNIMTDSKNHKIKMAAFSIIDKIIVLQYNVDEGCEEDRDELEQLRLRLVGIKKWAKETGTINDFRNYFAHHNFGHESQFIASDMAKFFAA